MAPEKKSLYEDAVTLLEKINQELADHRLLDTINSKMVAVVKDLNEVRIDDITGSNTKGK